ncbi:hypothetical protein V500_05393 [Pseudogymnoascus sp. VKM F-4518 (FW-2643)]|nr:hypothetical protein V500_05393 [Pseudogymnoascus sp. VKM F-4518 (FW-2643)]
MSSSLTRAVPIEPPPNNLPPIYPPSNNLPPIYPPPNNLPPIEPPPDNLPPIEPPPDNLPPPTTLRSRMWYSRRYATLLVAGNQGDESSSAPGASVAEWAVIVI